MAEFNGLFITSDLTDVLETLRGATGFLDDIKPSGNNIMITCPFHNGGHEKHPSCGVTKVEVKRGNRVFPPGTVHCFTCDYTASIEEFVSHTFNKKDGGAFGYKWLSRNFVSVEVNERKPLKLNFNRGIAIKASHFITEEELEKYRFFHQYMYTRKLTDKVINYFDIGYDADTQSMTMPVRDKDGNVVFVYRRSVYSKFFNNAEDTPRGLYLYGYNEVMRNINKVKELIVCESPIDALSAWVNKRAAVATFTAQITDEQIKLLKGIPLRKFVSGYDNDEAGWKATNKLGWDLRGEKLIYRLNIPFYAKDLNEIKNDDWDGLSEKLFQAKFIKKK